LVAVDLRWVADALSSSGDDLPSVTGILAMVASTRSTSTDGRGLFIDERGSLIDFLRLVAVDLRSAGGGRTRTIAFLGRSDAELEDAIEGVQPRLAEVSSFKGR
jgi:hypothetical protein